MPDAAARASIRRVKDLIVGIDLGTTNSLIGAIVDGQARLLVDADGTSLLPSVVSSSADGQILVGRPARNRRLLDPLGTARSVKRLMGSDALVQVGQTDLSPPEVSALILSALLDRAERELGARPTRAVITVPAYFDDHQRQATIDASEIAGLAVERLVNEPTAAAVAHQSGAEELVLVYDLGGGTFDVSILERDEGFMEVRASHGDTALGGDDIDAALLEVVLASLGPSANMVRADPRAMTRLEEAVERAKCSLSSTDEVRIHEPFLAGKGATVLNLDHPLRRADVDAVARPLLVETLARIDAAMADAGVRPDELDRVLLVGGASQMPIVAELLSTHLDMPVQLATEPERTVARGATLLAGRASGADVDEVLVDITPFTLAAGTAADDGPFGAPMSSDLVASPVIARGTVVPTRKTQTFYTMVVDQPGIHLPIAQGEAARFNDNTLIGELEVDDLPPSPARSPVDVTFQLDLSGVLHVSATHRPSMTQASTTIKHGPSRFTEQRRESSKALIEQLRGGGDEAQTIAKPEAIEPSSAQPSESERRLARSLLKRADRALGGDVEAALRERLSAAGATVASALEGDGDLERAVEALTDLLYELD